MYVINDYQIITVASQLYMSNDSKGVKIASEKLADILTVLQSQEKLEITEEQLLLLATQKQVGIDQLKKVLINQLNILKPMLSRKFPLIYVNADDPLVVSLLKNTLETKFNLEIVPKERTKFNKDSLVIFYRQNYSSPDFKILYQHLVDNVYVITAGVLHSLLLIDNLYFKGSGLPTHLSNLHQLMAYLNSDISATKNNWLLFYRDMVKNQIDQFPDPKVNGCQQGYIAYCLYQFISQFTNLWKSPTPLDQINWFWHADLTSFNVHSEVAIHSPFSEYDMKLNLEGIRQQESA